MALDAERARASFKTSELTEILNGREKTEVRRVVAPLLKRVPLLQELRDREPFNNKRQAIADMLIKTKRMHELVDEFDPKLQGSIVSLAAQSGIQFDYASPPFNNTLLSGVNSMFTGVIRSQMTQEQQQKWLPLAESRRILGTYAQTEMGHGSNVRGLETTATFDPATDEFVVHCPTLSSTKWWPAHLGFGCTHAIVYARLLLPNKATAGLTDHGVLPFMVQLRDMESYRPMPGVQLGTSGPTIGHYANEHGRCRFDKVRIPRENLCMRWQQVSPDGTYTAPAKEASKISYVTMTQTRVGFVTVAHLFLAKALTIGIRYSCVRKQGFPAPGLPETTVLDYQMQQHSMFTLLAAAYAIKFSAVYINDYADQALKAMGDGESSGDASAFLAQLPELHATTSGLKALSTKICCEGTESVRKNCGGHGYGVYSGLPQIALNALRSQTVEGDNNVLCLQVSRFLIKAWSDAKAKGKADKLAGNVAYLRGAEEALGQRCMVQTVDDWLSPETQLAAMGHWALRVVKSASEKVNADVARGVPDHEATNNHMFELVRMAYTHAYYSILNSFIEALKRMAASPEVAAVLKRLCDLFALSVMQADIGGVTLDGYVNAAQAEMLNEAIRKLLAELRPDAVALVDAFDFDDTLELHQTAIGSYDGRVYERLWEWSEKDPANNQEGNLKTGDLPPAFNEAWKPLLEYYKVAESRGQASAPALAAAKSKL